MTQEKLKKKRGRGRPLSFDRESVVRTAMGIFWEKGYEAVSLNEIASAANLPRASLYNSFGSKEQIYLEAIQAYLAEHPSRVVHEYEPSQNATRVFFDLFDDLCRFLTCEAKCRGCMGINAVNELIAETGELGDKTRELFGNHSARFEDLVRSAKQQGGLVNSASAATIAGMIEVFIAGLSTISKAGADEKELRKLCRRFLRQLGFQP